MFLKLVKEAYRLGKGGELFGLTNDDIRSIMSDACNLRTENNKHSDMLLKYINELIADKETPLFQVFNHESSDDESSGPELDITRSLSLKTPG